MTSRLGVRLFLVTAVLLRGIMDTSSRIFSTFNICQLTLSVGLSEHRGCPRRPAGTPRTSPAGRIPADVAAGRPEPRGRRRLPAGAPELKAPMRPQGAPMWPKATHGGRRPPSSRSERARPAGA